MSLLAVTGATGRIGGRVARTLSAEGLDQRLLVRDASRAPALPGAQVAVTSYDDPKASRAALAGVTTLLMVSAAEAPDRVGQHLAFVDAAADAGVEHVVYTSFYAAAPDATFTLARDHWATEEHIRRRGLRFTFLRDQLYADELALFAGETGVLLGPGGDGKVAAVSVADVAAVAALVLRDPEPHVGQTYALTGPEALTLAEVAEVIGRVTGRPVTYVAETLEEAYASRAPYDVPAWQVEAWVSTWTAIAKGELEGVSDDVRRLTGRPPQSLEDVLRAVVS